MDEEKEVECRFYNLNIKQYRIPSRSSKFS